MDGKDRQHWVFRAHVADRAGALTSIASAFSNEGISIDTVVGHGTEERTLLGGSVVLTFFCTADEKDVMVRKVKRLSKVSALEEHPYVSQFLRKSAIVAAARELKPRDVAGEESFLTCELVKKDAYWTYFLAGSPSELDQILTRLAAEGIVKDIVYSIVGL
ncbi:MAG: ACT domain-containing protein [Phycisphaerae bacterium]|nr:ACT domain-containing protein [Phycisphaerae bacterium]